MGFKEKKVCKHYRQHFRAIEKEAMQTLNSEKLTNQICLWNPQSVITSYNDLLEQNLMKWKKINRIKIKNIGIILDSI